MKKLSILFMLLISLITYSQPNISIQSVQDIRLAIIGDNRGNDAFTTNVLTTFKMNGHQFDTGYLSVGFAFEYADINENYSRWSGNVGWVFNQLIFKDFEVALYGNYGFINRWGNGFLSFGAVSEINYKLNDNFKLSLIGQATERNDLKYRYGTTIPKFSIFFGVEINLKSL
jgi:hypothetical protein